MGGDGYCAFNQKVVGDSSFLSHVDLPLVKALNPKLPADLHIVV